MAWSNTSRAMDHEYEIPSMSYCRFSCDNFKSDIYLFEDCAGGWTLYVATSRVVGQVPPLENIESPTFMESYTRQHDYLDSCRREKIGLEHDGECFRIMTIDDVLHKLTELRQIGYYVPQHAMDLVSEEIGSVGGASGS